MKKFKSILLIVLMIVLLILIYLMNSVQAKYVLSKIAKIPYKTSNYYFDVAVDKTDISSFPATLTITAKNNDGLNYTNADLTYTIGVGNSSYKVTATDGKNTRTLKGGSKQSETYTVTLEKTGTDTSDKINLTFTVSKPYSNSKNIQLNVSTIPAYYGKEVTNYTTGGVKWRVYHKDEEGRIYLIADDYLPYSSIPKTTKGNALKQGDTNYKAYFADPFNDYTGSAWIKANTNTNAQKWLNTYLSAYPTTTNIYINAVAYMMDTNVWGKFVDSKFAEYAIGGPTLELFCASYKVTHPDKYIECNSVTKEGYKVKWNDATSYGRNISGGNLTVDEFNKIYINSSVTKANAMWLASSGAHDTSYNFTPVYSVGHGSSRLEVEWSNCTGEKNYGFRPIVCLKSGVQLVNNGNGTYRLQ